MKKVLLSGMRPTGKLHLGHLVGALHNWVNLQEEYECYFMIADWHALMSEYEDPAKIRDYIYENLLDWLAVGLDPQKCTIFVQSHVPEHLELYMSFSTLTPLGWLERCPTYKEQMRELKDRHLATYAFLGYPVLQAADICLYNSAVVPVGEDQLPHLELTREIVRKFNGMYAEVFVEPKPLLTQMPRLLGLDGRKMSKSYDNFIALSDSREVIAKKVQTMFTDPKRIKKTDVGHPDHCNVCQYFGVFAPAMVDEVKTWCCQAQKGCTECKKILAEQLGDYLVPLQQKRAKLALDRARLNQILETGRRKAQEKAHSTIEKVRNHVGFLSCPIK
ncbi:MAG: tryptophan--tRNA ligase [Candidatus Omnitrophota bacterium]